MKIAEFHDCQVCVQIAYKEFQELPESQQLHLPIYSADDLKYSLTFIHQFRLQWLGTGDSSLVSPGDSPHLIDNPTFALEESAHRPKLTRRQPDCRHRPRRLGKVDRVNRRLQDAAPFRTAPASLE